MLSDLFIVLALALRRGSALRQPHESILPVPQCLHVALLVVSADFCCESRLIGEVGGRPVVLKAEPVAARGVLVAQVADAQAPLLVPGEAICEGLERVPTMHGALSHGGGSFLLRKLDLGLRR